MANVVKSILAQKLGAKAAAAMKKHANDETKLPGGGSLPDGIENGIAQLTECKVDVYKEGQNKGQPFFYAAGIVVAPEEHGGVPIKGLRTSIIEPLHDTPTRARKTFEDHIDWAMNQLRLLGFDTSSMGGDGSDFEAACAALKEIQPHFRFRTWKGKKETTGPYAGKEPRVNEVWMGQVEFSGDGTSPTDATVDATADASADPVADETVTEDDDSLQGEADAAGEDSGPDLDALVTKAEKKDKTARKELTDLALAAGFDQDAIDSAEDWAAVATMIREGSGGGSGDEAPADEPFVPDVGSVYFVTQTDPKTGKPIVDPKTKRPKRIEVEVTKLDKKGETATVKDLNSGKVLPKSVAWSDLSAE